jgi:hypothetical protein
MTTKEQSDANDETPAAGNTVTGGPSIDGAVIDTDSTVPTTRAIVSAAPSIPINEQNKQGSKCFGCCDFRRAVIIVDLVEIVLSGLSVALLLLIIGKLKLLLLLLLLLFI